MKKSRRRKRNLPPSGKSDIYAVNGSTIDAIEAMHSVVLQNSKSPTVKEIARYLKAKSNSREELLQNLANFAYKSAYFVPDPPQLQRVRTVENVLRTREANCVSYTVFISTILKALGIPVTMRAVQMEGFEGFNHIYPIVDDVPLDVVIDQVQDGTEFFQRPLNRVPTIGQEVPYELKLDTLIK